MVDETTVDNDTVATAQSITLNASPDGTRSVSINGSFDAPNSILLPSFSESEPNNTIGEAEVVGFTAGVAARFTTRTSIDPIGNVPDVDFFEVSALAGQVIQIEAMGLNFDPAITVFDADGNFLAFNDDIIFGVDLDSAITLVAPTNGEYYVAVHHFATFVGDPLSVTGSIASVVDDGDIRLNIETLPIDVDHYSIEVAQGEVIGVALDGLGNAISIIDPNGNVISGSTFNVASFYSEGSPLPGDSNTSVSAAAVATVGGTYTIAVTGEDNNYDLDIAVAQTTLSQQAEGNVQYVFLDFDGASFDANALFGEGSTNANLSGLSSFLTDFGLTASDEDAVIDAIIAEVQRILVDDLVATGNNPDFDIVLLNSRDHGDVFGEDNVSRVVIGGTENEFGSFGFFGIAESIDVGNFDTEETAVVLLDTFSAPANSSGSLNGVLLGSGVTIIDLIGAAVGSVAAHEAAHTFGLEHTTSINDVISVGDEGGSADVVPLGDDNTFGTADDPAFSFVADDLSTFEGRFGTANTPQSLAFGSSRGSGAGFAFDILADSWRYTGEDENDILNLSIIDGGQSVFASTQAGVNASRALLNGGTVNASFDTKEGDDVVVLSDLSVLALTLNAGAGNDQILSGSLGDVINGEAGLDLILAGAGADTVDGGADRDIIEGNDGNDLINGGDGDDLIFGDDGDDTIVGDDGLDVIIGGAGNDTLNGGAQDDIILGVSGVNTILGGLGNDLLIGGAEQDIINGNEGSDTIETGDGGDMAFGGIGADILIGGAGDDTLDGGADIDVLVGLAGDDFLNGGAEADTLVGGLGNDTLNGGDGADQIIAQFGANTLNGDAGADFLEGGELGDVLDGGADTDFILGGLGNDTLDGGAGFGDQLIGGAGADTFVFTMGDDGGVVVDFSNDEDMLDLSSFGFVDVDAALATGVQVSVNTFFDFNGDGSVTALINNTQLSDLGDDILV